jgi:hypothetical protein
MIRQRLRLLAVGLVTDEVRPPENVLCPVCSTAGRLRYLDDHTQEELEECERRLRGGLPKQDGYLPMTGQRISRGF